MFSEILTSIKRRIGYGYRRDGDTSYLGGSELEKIIFWHPLVAFIVIMVIMMAVVLVIVTRY